jgi:hypothetical protein
MYSQYSFYYIHECIRTFINFSVFCTKFQPVVIPSFKDDRVVVTTLESTWNSTLLKPRARTTFKHSTKLHYICIARPQSLCNPQHTSTLCNKDAIKTRTPKPPHPKPIFYYSTRTTLGVSILLSPKYSCVSVNIRTLTICKYINKHLKFWFVKKKKET